jgi:hypothetical protein
LGLGRLPPLPSPSAPGPNGRRVEVVFVTAPFFKVFLMHRGKASFVPKKIFKKIFRVFIPFTHFKVL